MRRRLFIFLFIALATAMSTTAWLYDGDLGAAVKPIVQQSLNGPLTPDVAPEQPQAAPIAP